MNAYLSSIRMPTDVEATDSSVRVSCGEDVAAADWWATCERDPGATFFATPAWTSILTEAFPCFRPKPFLFSFDGHAPCLIPAIEVRRWGGRQTALHSMPFGTYGGPVGSPNLTADQIDTALRILTRDERRRFQATVYPNPLGSALPHSFVTHDSYVHAPDLSRGWDGWWRAIHEKTRYHTRKAERRGVEVRVGADADTLEVFYHHYARAARNWSARDLFGARFFRAVWNHRSSGIQLWTAHKKGRMLAGVLVFLYRSQATVFLSFICPDARRFAPQNLIYSRLIRHACDTQCTQLSFLGSGGHPGVESFKQSIGGTIRPFRYINVRSPGYRLVGDCIRWVRERSGRIMRMVGTSALCLWIMTAFLATVPCRGWTAAGSGPWSQRFGGVDGDNGYSVAVDASGNIVITGVFSGTADFGGGPVVSAGSGDVFVAKYTAGGKHLWSRGFGGLNADSGSGVAIDKHGDLFVTGCFAGDIDFGGGTLATSGSLDVFVVKFDTGGNHLWSHRYGDAGCDGGYDIAVDPQGSVWLTGFFEGVVDFGGGPLAAEGSTDVFVAKLTPAGIHLASRRFGGANEDRAHRIEIDTSGNVFVTGQFVGDLELGGDFLVNAGGSDGFLAKFDTQGNCVWSRGFGGSRDDISYGLAVDESGDAFVTGYFQDRIRFGGSAHVGAGALDIFLAKYDSEGNCVWSKGLGGPGGDSGWALAVNDAGNVVVTGNIQATADFDGGSLTSAGGADIFLALYDSDGGYLRGQRFGDTEDDYAFGIATRSAEDVTMIGAFKGGVDLGGGELTSAGLFDIFLATVPFRATPGGGPRRFLLLQNYPNPFNPSTTIRYDLPQNSRVTLKVYNVRGDEIMILTNEVQTAGVKMTTWDGRNKLGERATSGVYFLELRTEFNTNRKKIVLLR